MSCKERDFEIEPGLEQAGKRRKTENTSSLVCDDVDRGDCRLIEDSCVENRRESVCESELKGDCEVVHPGGDWCILENVQRDVIPCASKSDEVICGSGDDRLTIIDTSCDTVVTIKSISEISRNDDKVDGDAVSRDIVSSSADQSSCFVVEQMHLESPSTDDLLNQISKEKQDTIMKDENDAQTTLVETSEDDKEEKPLRGIDVGRKLLVLDINGLLADVVSISYVTDDYKADIIIGMKAVFKRPHCDDFLQFCFERFNVGIWSSRTKKNVDSILDLLMGEHRSKLVFCWDQSHCTLTGFNTVDNKNKPLVLKELKKLWEKDDPSLPWNIGDYNESNTLLLDDSPYKGLKNPPNTAIFPHTYQYKNLKDDSLGPKGDLRSYLEGLSLAPNVQKHVELNSHGQRPITESNPSWRFYAKIIGKDSTKQEDSSSLSEIRHEKATTKEWSSEKIMEDQSFAKEIDSTEYHEHHSQWDKLPINKNEQHSNWDNWSKLPVGRSLKSIACSSHSNWDKLRVNRSLEAVACSSIKPFEKGRSICEKEKANSDPRGHHPQQPNKQNTQSTTKDSIHLSSKTDQQWGCRAGTTIGTRSPWIRGLSFGRNHEVFRKTKLLILDVNGLLADFVSYEPPMCKADSWLRDRAVFKRPYCDDFLNFCFDKFHIGFWMTTSRRNARSNLDLFLGTAAKNVLFSWDVSHCLDTGFLSLEKTQRKDAHILCKELRKIWENDEPNLKWGKDQFNHSNTLLVDNYPHTALLNPPHTAIFPPRYRYEDEPTDNTLGPEGDLRVFLEGLVYAEDVQEYVKNKQFGRAPISDENPSWKYYAGVIKDTKARQKPWLERWWTPANEHNSSLDKLKVDQNFVLTECSSVKPFENRSNYEDGSASSDTRGYNPTTRTDEQKRQSRTNDLVHLSYNKDQQQDCSPGCVTVVTSREPHAPWIPHSSMGNSQEVSHKTKLLILDVNGLLADFVSYEPDGYKANSFLGNKAVFKRPYCDDFLNFCFEKFNIGFWLTTSKRNTQCNLDFLLGRLTKDVLFSWDISYCFETGFGTFERRDRHIFFKELRRVWEDDQQCLPWRRGKFDFSNTLLVDNYPCTGLLNPPHTAIYPPRYWYKDVKTDNSLGPGGDLRVFLEGLALADNVQDYVRNNPFGQTPISEETPSWNYYARIVQDVKARQKAWSERGWAPTNAHQRTC